MYSLPTMATEFVSASSERLGGNCPLGVAKADGGEGALAIGAGGGASPDPFTASIIASNARIEVAMKRSNSSVLFSPCSPAGAGVSPRSIASDNKEVTSTKVLCRAGCVATRLAQSDHWLRPSSPGRKIMRVAVTCALNLRHRHFADQTAADPISMI